MLTAPQQELLAQAFDGLPPKSCKHTFLTPDQLKEWEAQRFYWQVNLWGLKLFFAGKSIPDELEAQGINDHGLLVYSVKKWIRLYELLNFAWVAIKTKAKEQNRQLPVNEPGEAIAYILHEKAKYQFRFCLMPYSEFRPRKTYKDTLKAEKLSKKEINCEGITPIDRAWEKTTISHIKNNIPDGDWCKGDYFLDFCLEVCAESKRGGIIADTYQEYLKIENKLFKMMKREITSKGCLKAEYWVKGELRHS